MNDLSEEEQLLLAAALRPTQGTGAYAAISNARKQLQANDQLNAVRQRRAQEKADQEQKWAQLSGRIADGSATAQELMAFPMTREMGMKRAEAERAKAEQMRNWQSNGPGSDVYRLLDEMSSDRLVGFVNHPTMGEQAKALLELRTKALDPTKMYMGPGRAGPGALPGAVGFEAQLARAKRSGEPVNVPFTTPDGQQATQMMTHDEFLQSRGQGSSFNGPTGGAPGGGATLPPTGPGASPRALPNAVSMGGGGAPGGGFRAPTAADIPPQMLAAEKAGTPLTMSVAPNGQQTINPQLGGQPGVALSAAGQTKREADRTKMITASSYLKGLEELQKLNAGGPGGFPGMVNDAIAWGTGKPTSGSHARGQMANIVGNMAKTIIKDYGANPSNIDVQMALKSITDMNQPPETRAAAMETLKNMILYDLEVRGLPPPPGYGPKQNPTDPTAAQPTPVVGKQSALPSAAKVAAGQGDPLLEKPSFLDTLGERAMGFGRGMQQGLQEAQLGLQQNLPAALVSAAGHRPAAQEDVKRFREQKYDGPGSSTGEFASNFVNPLNWARAGSLPLAVALGGAMGRLQPHESDMEQNSNTAFGAIGGGAGNLLEKVIPKTAISKTLEKDGDTKRLMDMFPNFRPDGSQMVDSTGPQRRVAKMFGVADRSAEAQTKAGTQHIMEYAGMKPGALTQSAIKKADEAHEATAKAMFPRTVAAKIDTIDKKALAQAVNDIPEIAELAGKNGERYTAQLMQALEDVGGRTAAGGNRKVVKIPMETLYLARQELKSMRDARGIPEAVELFDNFIEKQLTAQGKDPKAFRKLTDQRDTLKELEFIFRSGTGAHPEGWLRPSKLEGYIRDIKNPNSKLKDLNELFHTFGVRDYGPAVEGDAVIKGLMNQGIDVMKVMNYPAKALAWANPSGRMLNAPESVKNVVEALRRAQQPWMRAEFSENNDGSQ